MTTTIVPRTLTGTGRDAVRRPRMLQNTLTMAWRAMLRIRREPELATFIFSKIWKLFFGVGENFHQWPEGMMLQLHWTIVFFMEC